MTSYDSESLRDFDWHGHSIRSLMINGEPWFVAHDVTRALTYTDGPGAVSQHVSPGQTTKVKCSSDPTWGDVGPNPYRTIISEAGLYELVFGSKHPQAVIFRQWVTQEVLPQIRKTGSYSTDVPALPDFETAEGRLAVLDRWREDIVARDRAEKRVRQTEQLLELAAPMVEAFEQFMDSSGRMVLRDVAKVLKPKRPDGKLVGPRMIFGDLKRLGLIYRTAQGWVPVQKYENAGYFEVKVAVYEVLSGSPGSRPQLVVTPAGLEFIRKLLINNGYQIENLRPVSNDLGEDYPEIGLLGSGT